MEELRSGPVPPEQQIRENADELWDIYDRDRRRTGRTCRRGAPWPAGAYRLEVHICIFDSRNRLLIQQRQPWKRGWPGMWDVSVGGSVQAGDDSRSTAVREVREELGLELAPEELFNAVSLNFSQGFDDFWIVHRDVAFSELTLQPSEVQAVRLATRQQVRTMLQEGSFIPYPHLDLLFRLAARPEDADLWLRS